MFRESHLEEVTVILDLKREESTMLIFGEKGIPGRGNSQCKGPEVGKSLV